MNLPHQQSGSGRPAATSHRAKTFGCAPSAAVMLALDAPSGSAEVVNGGSYLDGVTVNSFSSEINWPGTLGHRAAANTANGSGLNTTTGLHDKTATNEWMTRGTSGWAGNGISPDPLSTATTDTYIIFDLGALYDLTSIHVWNFDEGDNGNPADLTLNAEGVAYGMAWMLGAATPSAGSLGLLPTVTAADDGFLTLHFSRVLVPGSARLYVAYGDDLVSWTTCEVPAVTDHSGVVKFDVATAGGLLEVHARIPLGGAGKRFVRLAAAE